MQMRNKQVFINFPKEKASSNFFQILLKFVFQNQTFKAWNKYFLRIICLYLTDME